jgi:hypothetical protein
MHSPSSEYALRELVESLGMARRELAELKKLLADRLPESRPGPDLSKVTDVIRRIKDSLFVSKPSDRPNAADGCRADASHSANTRFIEREEIHV